jgi:hypothetical protein
MKVVVNRCFGGFGLSYIAVKRYFELQGWKFLPAYEPEYGKGYKPLFEEEAENRSMISYYQNYIPEDKDNQDEDYWENAGYWSYYDLERTDSILIQVIEELGDKADGWAAKLDIVDVPDDVNWYIDDYDGVESVRENHRSW